MRIKIIVTLATSILIIVGGIWFMYDDTNGRVANMVRNAKEIRVLDILATRQKQLNALDKSDQSEKSTQTIMERVSDYEVVIEKISSDDGKSNLLQMMEVPWYDVGERLMCSCSGQILFEVISRDGSINKITLHHGESIRIDDDKFNTSMLMRGVLIPHL